MRIVDQALPDRKLLHRPIFILGCHKSGTTLLACLLDGHPDVFVMPLEMHLLQFSGYRLNYPLRGQKPRRHTRDQRIGWMVRYLNHSNRSEKNYGPGMLDGRLDVERFEQFLRGHEWSSDAEYCQLCLRAMHVGLTGGDLPPHLRVVEKSVENAGLAPDLRRMFPDCLFVHIVRNPYATVVAVRKAFSEAGYPCLGRIILSVRDSFQAMLDNERRIDGYKVVRFEDLVTRTESVMRDLAGFLRLRYSESMLKPTRMGQPWRGNSTSDRLFDGISTAPLTNWRDAVLALEVALVNRWLGPLLDRFGYDRLPSPAGGAYRGIAGERTWTYVRNRLLLVKGPQGS